MLELWKKSCLPAIPRSMLVCTGSKSESLETLSQGACRAEQSMGWDGMESGVFSNLAAKRHGRFPWLAAKLSGLDSGRWGDA